MADDYDDITEFTKMLGPTAIKAGVDALHDLEGVSNPSVIVIAVFHAMLPHCEPARVALARIQAVNDDLETERLQSLSPEEREQAMQDVRRRHRLQ